MPSNPYVLLGVLVSVVVLSVGGVGVVYTARRVAAEVRRLWASWQVSRACRWNLRHPLRPVRATQVDEPFVCPIVDEVCPVSLRRHALRRQGLPLPRTVVA